MIRITAVLGGSGHAAAGVTIRRGELRDAAALAEFAARTFVEAFGRDNRPEDLAAHLAASYGVPQQSRQLTDPDYLTLLAEQGTTLAAYAQLRRQPAPACVTGPAPIEIYRFYVDAPWHGQGVAQALMAAAFSAAAGMGGATLWLSTWDRNARGLAFYAKCGFHDVGTADFYVGSDRQTDRILAAVIGTPAAA